MSASDITLIIGTSKGVFLLDGAAARDAWSVRGPFCTGWPINHVASDPETGRLWAAGGNQWNGAGIWRSGDGGATWDLTKLAKGQVDDMIANEPELAEHFGMKPSPPADFDGEVDAIWSLHFAHGTLFTGTKPATLFASRNGGESFEKVQGLTEHPSAEEWQPGGAGLTLHTILSDPADARKIWVGISAAGVFASEDGGDTWERRNRRSNVRPPDAPVLMPGLPDDEIGQCVHNMVRAPTGSGDLLYQQNHHGVFRSRDGGRSWNEITDGLPSHFGFPISVHPREPETLWVLPLTEDMGRFPPDASAAVWKSTDAGETWQKRQDGLPVENCFFTVLRQAMSTDNVTPAGLYFGTNSGSVFASRDEGDSWTEIARHLPTVLCVEVAQRAA